MTTTPTPWNTVTQANTTDGGASQQDAAVARLADGGYLVSWRDDSGATEQIVGQRYDILGHKVGGEIDLDHRTGDSHDASLASLADGSVAVAFSNSSGLTSTIFVQRFDATLGSFTTETIGGGMNVFTPSIVGFAAGGYVVGETVTVGGELDLYAQIVSADGTVGSLIPINTQAGHASDRSRVAVLSNGNFVITYDHDQSGAGDEGVNYQVRSKTGAVVHVDSIVKGADSIAGEQANDVAALKNGGFVVVWEDSDGDAVGFGVRASIYNNAGGEVATDILVNSTQAGRQDAPFVTALSDGGFVVGWADAEAGLTRGQRFAASGSTIGAEFTIKSGSSSTLKSAAVELGDGRIAYGLTHIGAGVDNEIKTVIFDPRTSPIKGTADDDSLTGRVEGGKISGLSGADKLYGVDGKDTLLGGKGEDRLDGGAGADRLVGGKGADKLFAGDDDAKDMFVFASKHDSGDEKKSGWDKLYDFDTHAKHEAVSDKIDLSGIDADKGEKHDQDFHFVDKFGDAHGKQPDGQVTIEDAGKNVKVLIDVNGDSEADMILLVMGVQHLHKADFIL